jgi:hypothetical protein
MGLETIHLHLVSGLRMRGAIPPFLHIFSRRDVCFSAGSEGFLNFILVSPQWIVLQKCRRNFSHIYSSQNLQSNHSYPTRSSSLITPWIFSFPVVPKIRGETRDELADINIAPRSGGFICTIYQQLFGNLTNAMCLKRRSLRKSTMLWQHVTSVETLSRPYSREILGEIFSTLLFKLLWCFYIRILLL